MSSLVIRCPRRDSSPRILQIAETGLVHEARELSAAFGCQGHPAELSSLSSFCHHRDSQHPQRLGDTTQHLASRHRETSASVSASGIRAQKAGDTERQLGDTTPEPASHLTAETGDTGRQAGNTARKTRSWRHRRASVTASSIQTQTSRRRPRSPMGDTGRQAGDTTPEPVLAETDTGRQAGDTERQLGDPGASVTASGIWPQGQRDTSQHLASDRRDWETQGDKQETRPRSQRQSGIRPPRLGARVTKTEMGDTGRQAGDTTPEPASQHLATQGDKRETRPWSPASDHRDWETQGDKQLEPASQHLASDRRDWETGSGKQDPGIGVTLSCSLHLKLEPQCGKMRETFL